TPPFAARGGPLAWWDSCPVGARPVGGAHGQGGLHVLTVKPCSHRNPPSTHLGAAPALALQVSCAGVAVPGLSVSCTDVDSLSERPVEEGTAIWAMKAPTTITPAPSICQNVSASPSSTHASTIVVTTSR